MKHFKSILTQKLLLLLIWLSSTTSVSANIQLEPNLKLQPDSAISISLITCQPGEESWSIYGHTAIHYINKEKNIDVAVNYGMFNFHRPHFVLRFIFGLTDYEMGIQPYDLFCAAYAYERRGIVEQELNLSASEKQIIATAIEDNYRPENREFRYNFFYDNCTTRARDMILSHISTGKDNESRVSIQRQDNGPSLREMTHEYTRQHPWTQLGNDLLLGVKADHPTSASEQQFLPFNLMEDFDQAIIDDKPLVKEKHTVVPMFDREETPTFSLSPIACAIILAVIIITTTAFEYFMHRIFWLADAILLLVIGLCGLILTAMIFSQHPTVQLNLQILMLNPLALVCLLPVTRCEIRNRKHWFWMLYAACIVLFFLGNAVQCYAEGMNILALSLLIRSLERVLFHKSKRAQT